MKSIFRSFRPSSPTPPATSSQPPDPRTIATPGIFSGSKNAEEPLTIVELFQSQGCDSCPPSNANLLQLTSKTCPPSQTLAPLPSDQSANILLLTYHVTYWDYLGWPDTFANRAFDERQRDYVSHMKLRSAFTPQVIVNGRSSGVGNSKGDLARVLREGAAGQALPVSVTSVRKEGSTDFVVSINAPDRHGASELAVLVMWYDPSIVDVRIPRGENAGKILPHRNVVKSVQKLGDVRAGGKGVFVIETGTEGLRGVVLVQEGLGGKIVGAAGL